MDLNSLISQAQGVISVLSNPKQSALAAAGAAGVFSAEVNNLRQAAQVNLADFGVNIPTPLRGFYTQATAPFQRALAGSPSNPIPDGPSGTIFGMNYLTAGLLILGGIASAVFLLGRRSR